MKGELLNVVFRTTLMLLLAFTYFFTSNIKPVEADSATIIVPDDYPTIQEAINNAAKRDTIFVRNGTYWESVVVNKSVSLIGESWEAIVDGLSPVVKVVADNVTVKGFTLMHSSFGMALHYDGISLLGVENCSIIGNKITMNQFGIYLYNSRNNTISENHLSDYDLNGFTWGNLWGILLDSSSNNLFSGNNLTNSRYYGISIESSPYNTFSENVIVHNEEYPKPDFAHLYVTGSTPSDYVNFIDASNTINGQPVIYWVNEHDKAVPTDAGYVALVNCTSITAQNLNLSSRCHGILVVSTENSTITQNNMTNNLWGVFLKWASNNTIFDNHVVSSEYRGIQAVYSNHTRIFDNNVTCSSYGICIERCSNNSIYGNNVIGGTGWGINLWVSSNNELYENQVNGILLEHSPDNSLSSNNITSYFWVEGDNPSEFINFVDASNFIGGKPIYYWVNEHDKTVPSDGGCVVLVNCADVTVQNLNLSRNSVGMLLVSTNQSIITQNNIPNTGWSIWMLCSSDNIISENDLADGIWLQNCSDNSIFGNNISRLDWTGIFLLRSSNNSIIRNNIECEYAGVDIRYSSNNTFYHNNFVTKKPILNNWGSSTNSWDNGYPSGGNYWSSYVGIDLFSGSYQNETGSDGIGDTPCSLFIVNPQSDRYPLMKLYAGPHDIGIIDFDISKTIVGQGYCMNTTLKMINYGLQTETFNVTINVNLTMVLRQTVTLTARNSTTIHFVWNTTEFEIDNYTLTATTDIVSGEIDMSDNNSTVGLVFVTIPGDVTSQTTGVPDGRVDMRDIGTICDKFATTPADPEWDPNMDVNGDGVVNMRDISIACDNFMKT